jgi:hypothetical protein
MPFSGVQRPSAARLIQSKKSAVGRAPQLSPRHKFSYYLYIGAGSAAAATGGGALPLPLPIVPQALRPATESNAIVKTRILLIK